MDLFVGALTKKLRKARGMTLQYLGQSTNLSVGYLSLMERGQTSPTVASLHKICQALNVTMADLFANLESDKKCIKNNERRVIFDEPNSLRYEAVTEGSRPFTSIFMSVFDDSVHESSPHVADECGFILQGSMILTIDGLSYSLEKWDSIYVTAGSIHTFHKTSDCPCISLWSAPSVTYDFLHPLPHTEEEPEE
ncbi:MAG: helix-turn-helix domain-containing protein [Synergistaceae bacterium]|jgi:transcriptional regulator with XRE-family HTH domain|nr:helix-turn-helix domain-containing protein [Synergistaceae bacterium]